MPPDDCQRILDCIRRLVRLLRLSERAAERAVGLSGARLFVLQELGREPALSLNDLAQRTRTDQSSVSVVVTHLADAGFVQRRRSGEDARRTELSLTRRGRAIIRKAPQVAQQLLRDGIDQLSPADRNRFARLFARLVQAAGADEAAPAPMLFEDERATVRVRRAAAGRAGRNRARSK
jgi:DNA-binding MarR family transcriptional regulator